MDAFHGTPRILDSLASSSDCLFSQLSRTVMAVSLLHTRRVEWSNQTSDGPERTILANYQG